MKTFLLFIGLLAAQAPCMGQFRIGAVFGSDLYHWYRNPNTVPDSAGRSVGNALLNISVGPKIWVGGERVGERPHAFLYTRIGFSPKTSAVAALGIQVGLVTSTTINAFTPGCS